jgi:hypothetical protein
MPSSINGIGTGLIAASRKRKINGQIQFDAIEAGMICYLPLIPIKALHILNIATGGGGMMSEQYQFVPLRFSWRLVLKAFLNRWGTVLSAFGLLFLILSSFCMATMPRRVNNSDITFVVISATAFLIGIICKIAWYLLSRKDEKLKDLIGSHGLGSSDPWDWKAEQVETTTQAILQQESLPSLVEVARRAIKDDKRSEAAFCLRLAMRDSNNIEAQDMMSRLLAE